MLIQLSTLDVMYHEDNPSVKETLYNTTIIIILNINYHCKVLTIFKMYEIELCHTDPCS